MSTNRRIAAMVLTRKRSASSPEALVAHDRCSAVAAQGSEVSRRCLLQNQLIQRQVRHRPAEPREDQDEAALGLWQLDDLKRDAVPGSGIGSTLAGVALIDPGQFDGVVGDGL
jgi:hypothetical protein